MRTHVCLISAQAAANLLPALDPDLKPERAILVVSNPMQKQAENLAAVLKEAGIKTEFLRLIDEHDFGRIEADILDLASSHEGNDIALNLTGGTKLMALAAQSVANAANWRTFYVDVDTDQVSWLHKDAPTPRSLTEQLRLRHYLRSYGFSLQSPRQRPQASLAQQSLADTLVRQIGTLEQPLAQLNWLAQQAEDKRSLDVRMDVQQQSNHGLEALLRNFSDADALTIAGDAIHFAGEASRSFVKGGWLELHVFNTINALTGELKIRDKAANLEVIDGTGLKSELDIAFMAHNRLFIIECKTARMDKPEAPKANDTLFKLAENSRRIGGLGTHGMLVSYRPLRDPERKLAQALGIELVCGADINRLPEKLKCWVCP